MIQPLEAVKTVGTGYYDSYRAAMLDSQILSRETGSKQCPAKVAHR
jgi:hypothetical protein